MDKKEVGLLLLEFIEDHIGELEWRKYETRYSKKWNGKEFTTRLDSSKLPFIAFRFKNKLKVSVKELQKVVNGYEGAYLWVMHGYKRKNTLGGINWIIQPKIVYELSKSMNKNEVNNKLCNKLPLAFDDLNNLNEYIQKNI